MVAALPTSLRPPHQAPNQSAELSPDAPPDERQDSIVAALQRGTSSTAGATEDAADEGRAPEVPGAAALPSPPDVRPPRYCPRGFGDPPRQVESFYSAPCAGAWQGDNGGATYRGVTATEVRVGVVQIGATSDGLALDDGEGPAISDTAPEGESDAHRTWRVYQAYFNQNFQLWGRRLQFFVRTVNGDTEAEVRAAAQEMDEEHQVFAINSLASPALQEAARRGLVGEGGWNLGGDLYRNHQPHLASWWMDGARLMATNAEYLCQRVVGRPANHAGDPALATRGRKLGMITQESAAFGNTGGADLPALVGRRCGADVVVQRWAGRTTSGSAYGTAIAQFRLNDVTTVVVDLAAVDLAVFLSTADAQGYFPEWYIPGTWSVDWSEVPFVLQFSRNQWAHAFGVSGILMAQSNEDRDHYRAYKTIDADGDPSSSVDRFVELQQLVNGIQMAGPDLNPRTWRQGLNAMGTRTNNPPWSASGGFAPDDHSYIDDVAEIWWDNTAPNYFVAGQPGSYRYVHCGQRVALGTIPATEPAVFNADGTCTVAPGQA